jgi:hypothetical protein
MKLLTKRADIIFFIRFQLFYFLLFLSIFFLLQEIGESNESILLTRVKVIENYIAKGNSSALNVFEVNNEVYYKRKLKRAELFHKR